MITMFDGAYNDQFPARPQAVAGYVDGGIGDQPNYNWVVRAFPHARHLSIALFAGHDAHCLDVESGAASPEDIPGWHARQVRRGIARPVIYANASTMKAGVLPLLARAGITRSSVRLWSAHYAGPHVCGPSSCGAVDAGMDGTQWTSNAMGRVLDQSLLNDDFFGTTSPTWTENIVQQLPVLKLGASGVPVRRVQALLVAMGYDLGTTGPRKDGIDGSYGDATEKAVRAAQKAAGFTAAQQDGIVGPLTYAVLLGV